MIHFFTTQHPDKPVIYYERSGLLAFDGTVYALMELPGDRLLRGLEHAIELRADVFPPFKLRPPKSTLLVNVTVAWTEHHSKLYTVDGWSNRDWNCSEPITQTHVRTITHGWRRVQRWFRTVARERRATRERKRLEFAMGSHAWLCDDIVRAIGLLIW